MEVPRLGVQSELQLPAYATATATPDPSWVCDLHHSSGQHQILNPLNEARDGTWVLMDTSWIPLPLSHNSVMCVTFVLWQPNPLQPNFPISPVFLETKYITLFLYNEFRFSFFFSFFKILLKVDLQHCDNFCQNFLYYIDRFRKMGEMVRIFGKNSSLTHSDTFFFTTLMTGQFSYK